MLLQILSVAGALMVLAGYFANQRGWLGRHDRRYSLLNAVGAGLLCWVAIVDRRWGFVLLEGSWMLMSIPPIFRPPPPED